MYSLYLPEYLPEPGCCFYCTNLVLDVFTDKNNERKNYFISLFNQSTSNEPLKVTMFNEHLLKDHYTAYITTTQYADMKTKQALLIEFADLLNELKSLLVQCVDNKLQVKFVIERNRIELKFYTTSKMKELVLLAIPFNHTSRDEKIEFLLKCNESSQEHFRRISKHAQEQLNDIVLHNAELVNYIDKKNKEKKDLLANVTHLTTENVQHKKLIQKIVYENTMIKKEKIELLGSLKYLQSNLNLQKQETDQAKKAIAYESERHAKIQEGLHIAVQNCIEMKKRYDIKKLECDKIRTEKNNLKNQVEERDAIIKKLEEDIAALVLPTAEDPANVICEMIAKLEIQVNQSSTSDTEIKED